MNEAIKCYAVTNQSSIIPLKEVERKTYKEQGECDFIKIVTEIDGEVRYQSHCESHHRIYFKEMWLDESGFPDNGAVFKTFEEAKTYAIKLVVEKIRKKQNELNELKDTLEYVSAQLGG